MTTLRSGLEQLEQQQWRDLMEELDGYFAGRSVKDVSFFVSTDTCRKFLYPALICSGVVELERTVEGVEETRA